MRVIGNAVLGRADLSTPHIATILYYVSNLADDWLDQCYSRAKAGCAFYPVLRFAARFGRTSLFEEACSWAPTFRLDYYRWYRVMQHVARSSNAELMESLLTKTDVYPRIDDERKQRLLHTALFFSSKKMIDFFLESFFSDRNFFEVVTRDCLCTLLDTVENEDRFKQIIDWGIEKGERSESAMKVVVEIGSDSLVEFMLAHGYVAESISWTYDRRRADSRTKTRSSATVKQLVIESNLDVELSDISNLELMSRLLGFSLRGGENDSFYPKGSCCIVHRAPT